MKDICRKTEDEKPGAVYCLECLRYKLELCEEGRDGGWRLKQMLQNGVWQREKTS